MSISTKVKLEPCAFCGTADPILGMVSYGRMGIQCSGKNCGALIARDSPKDWPEGLYDRNLTIPQNYANLDAFTLLECVKVWNAR